MSPAQFVKQEGSSSVVPGHIVMELVGPDLSYFIQNALVIHKENSKEINV